MERNQNDERYSKDYFDNTISENEDIIKKLNSELSEKNIIISRTKSYLFDLEFDLNTAKNKISSLEADLVKNEIEINSKDNKIQNITSQIENNKAEINNLLNQINSKDNEIQNITSQIENNKAEINNLLNQINSKDNIIQNITSQIENNKAEINNLLNQINSLEGEYAQKREEWDNQIYSLESDLVKREIEANNLLNQINSLENELNQKNNDLHNKKEAFDFMENKYIQQSSKLDAKEYCISCYEEKIKDDALEIEYLKKNVLIKKFLNPFTYLYLVFKSKPSEISINFKLYKALKNSKCFDVGYYLNNNNDLVESKWCKYFSPELHYICNGFGEGRQFNKKYFNRDSKKELLNYISKCT